jgi:hypothetical protein
MYLSLTRGRAVVCQPSRIKRVRAHFNVVVGKQSLAVDDDDVNE